MTTLKSVGWLLIAIVTKPSGVSNCVVIVPFTTSSVAHAGESLELSQARQYSVQLVKTLDAALYLLPSQFIYRLAHQIRAKLVKTVLSSSKLPTTRCTYDRANLTLIKLINAVPNSSKPASALQNGSKLIKSSLQLFKTAQSPSNTCSAHQSSL